MFAYLATLYGTHGQALARGVRTSYVVTLVILVATVVVATMIFVRGGARIHAPDLRAYLQDNESALESPPIVGNTERPQASETLKDALRSVVEPVISDTAEPRDEERPSGSDDSSSRRAVREGEAPARLPLVAPRQDDQDARPRGVPLMRGRAVSQ